MVIPLKDYHDLFWRRGQGAPIKALRAMEDQFADPQTDEERAVWDLISRYRTSEATRIGQEVFKQRRRLADAERMLASKVTRKAQEDQRIATAKIPQLLDWLGDLKRTEPAERDARFFPGTYVSVMVVENGQRVLKPMRYQCRPAQAPASFDQKYPGTYNARRDSLGGYWKGTFGVTHGVIVVSAFYEHVERSRPDGSVENLVLKFEPESHEDMLAAVLWAHWDNGTEQLDSFALVTDDPPPEVLAAGHDRCIISIKTAHLETWLNPSSHSLDALQVLLDDRERLLYEHRLVA